MKSQKNDKLAGASLGSACQKIYKAEEDHLLPLSKFFRHLTRNLFYGGALALISLWIGMLGYHHYEKMSWVDSYVNAAMILSGMGPVSTLQTDGGKIFAGTYALFSGIIFLIVMAIIFAPVFKRFFHALKIEFPSK
jgi:hypothetical protein